MKKNKLLLLIPTLFLVACNNNPEPKETLLRRYEYYNTESKLIKATDYDYYEDNKTKLITEYSHSSQEDRMYKSETQEYNYSENKETSINTSFDKEGTVTYMEKSEKEFDTLKSLLANKESSSKDKGQTWKVDLNYSYSYTYDDHNNITSMEMKESVYDSTAGAEYLYDEENREISALYYQVIDDTKIYIEKTLHEYKSEENYRTLTVSDFYIEDEQEYLNYKYIYYYYSNNFIYKVVSYEDDELCSTNNYSYDGNVVVETSLTYSSSTSSYHTTQITTSVYDKDVTDEKALLLKEIVINPSSSTGHNKKSVRNYKYDEWGHMIETEYKSYIFSGDYERLTISSKEIWIYS